MNLTRTELQVLQLLLESIEEQHSNIDLTSISMRDRAYFLREFYADELARGDMEEGEFEGIEQVHVHDLAEFFIEKAQEALDEPSDSLLPIVEHSSNSFL